jgi:hypothetical protein
MDVSDHPQDLQGGSHHRSPALRRGSFEAAPGLATFVFALGLLVAVLASCADREPTSSTAQALDTCANTVDGAHCSDGNPCTRDDVCLGHHCVGTAVPNGQTCTDGDPCTSPDTCQQGQCIPGPVLPNGSSCDDDADLCHTTGTCQSGFCLAGPEMSCDDGKVCTVDRCDPVRGCVSTPNPFCIDGSVPEGGLPDASFFDGGSGGDASADGAGRVDGAVGDGAASDAEGHGGMDGAGGTGGGAGFPDGGSGGAGFTGGAGGGAAGEGPGGARGPRYTAKGGACSCTTAAEPECIVAVVLLATVWCWRRRRQGRFG